MKWEPSDIIRLVALLGALLLFALGALMMWQGITAEGSIDITSSVISGSLKTGSAGLFIVFLSFVVVVFVLFASARGVSPGQTSTTKEPSKSRRIAIGFFILLAAFIVSASLAALGYGPGFGLLASALGFMTLFTGIALLVFMEIENS